MYENTQKDRINIHLSYRCADKNDVHLLNDLYNDAFYDDYCRYGECPGYGKTEEMMLKSLQSYPKEIIYFENKPVGVISVKQLREDEYIIGCLCVIPEYQGRGIGTAAFHYLLQNLKQWKRISLITPCENKRNIKFYIEKCGFVIEEKLHDGNVALYRFLQTNW